MYVGVAFLAAMWKWYYYAPNTYKQLKISQLRKEGIEVTEEDSHAPFTLPVALLDPAEAKKYRTGPFDFMSRVMGPYLFIRFFLLPSPLLLLSRPLFWTAVANLALADMLSNIHSFIIIATNHCGDDMYTFEESVVPKSGSYYMRAVTSSANFRTGGDLNDFMHGWLNYQVEHHAWPQLSMLSYQRSQPEVKALCEKHGIPYTQESVWIRLRKTVNIMTGKDTQRPYPPAYELEKDMMVWNSNKVDSVAARKSVEEINSNILGDAKFKEVSEVTA